jgi:excisionase family DNA binding protein
MEHIVTARPGIKTYSVPEAGKMANLGKNTSYEAARRGEIPTIKFGKLLRVPAAAWDRKLRGEAV